MTDDAVERKSLIGFVATVVLLGLVSVVAIVAVRSYGSSVQLVAHSHEVISELEALSAALGAAEAARRGYLATGDASYLNDRDSALSKLQSHLQSAKLLTNDDSDQQKRLHELEARLAKQAAQGDDLVTVRTAGPSIGQRASSAQEVRQGTLDALATIAKIETSERGRLAVRRGSDAAWARVLISTFVFLLITVVSIMSWMFIRVRKEMSERKQQAMIANQGRLALQAANRELESFSYSVSHDLRSPLRAIDGYSLMLQEDYGAQLDDTGRRYITVIRNGTQRMAALIDDLLTFSRLSRQALNRQTVDMNALARRAAAEVLEGQAGPKPALSIGELPPVPGDPALLRQVWTNLLSNAVKYSSKSPAPQVWVHATREGATVRFEIEDNGVGFDMKYADKLFGVFQRLHAVDDYPGTGVGLAIVQRIINRHEGSVSAQGERGKGAKFGFTLPTEN